MGIVIYGRKIVPIGVDELMLECPSCEVHNFADILVFSSYYHFYWIPFFPIGKEASITCQKCGLQRNGLGFDSRSLVNHQDIKSKFRHPFFTYIGIGLVLVIVIYAIIDSIR